MSCGHLLNTFPERLTAAGGGGAVAEDVTAGDVAHAAGDRTMAVRRLCVSCPVIFMACSYCFLVRSRLGLVLSLCFFISMRATMYTYGMVQRASPFIYELCEGTALPPGLRRR